jgi:hypothetical protein
MVSSLCKSLFVQPLCKKTDNIGNSGFLTCRVGLKIKLLYRYADLLEAIQSFTVPMCQKIKYLVWVSTVHAQVDNH